jgi:transcriptional regulator with GAF, ATPase, and Fis domain/FixJ family two-component response regulator
MKILIVDDRRENLYLLESLLKGFGHEVDTATNGQEALDQLHGDGFRMVISDILMPVMDGFQLCREVRADDVLKDMLFVFYTATYTDKKDEDLALKMGADKFIRKPIEPEAFMRIIQDVTRNAEKLKEEPGQAAAGEEEEVFKLYSERLVKKLEKKMLRLEAEMAERKKAERALAERLRFERLLSELSAIFVNLPASEVDKEIEHGLQLFVAFLEVDRSTVFQTTEDNRQFRATHSWAVEGATPLLGVTTKERFPWGTEKVLQGEGFTFSRPEDLPDEASRDKAYYVQDGLKSQAVTPLMVGGSVLGAVSFDSLRAHRAWPEELVKRLRVVGEVFANALMRKQAENALLKALSEIEQLKEQLQADYTYLREEIKLAHNFDEIIGQSESLRYVLFKVEQVSATDATVLILGETGTGKELIARAIHNASSRGNRPLVKVNCATLPPNLIESELFGHEKGAFTGAETRLIGRFELANGATIFLDEIGELPVELQVKLLRVLQDGEFERLGSTRTIRVDVRVIAATNRNLEQEVENGRFRRDLWYRLNVFPITVPPLRQRREDIPLLVNAFVTRFSKKLGKEIRTTAQETMRSLQDYPWPGNVRELENVIERAVINAQGPTLRVTEKLETPRASDMAEMHRKSLEEVERDYIVQILEETHWRVDGPRGAALILGLNPATLRSRMRKLGIRRPSPRN